MTNLLELLGSSLPVVAAPMSGGPTTTAPVLAAAEAGSAGSLAGGYQIAEALAEQVAVVRASTEPYGVNLFSPNPEPVDPVDVAPPVVSFTFGLPEPAAAAGNPEHVNLWAGTGHRSIEARPAGAILNGLVP